MGKVAAAGAAARAFDPSTHAAALSVGVAGSLPGSPAGLCEAVLATRSLTADEGLLAPDGFSNLEEMGFPPPGWVAGGVAPPEWLAGALRPLADHEGPVATVSTCSGTDAAAEEVARRTGAVAEAMEGAAIAQTLAAIAGGRPPFAELRVISNTTGDRGRQVWDIRRALARLGELVASIDVAAVLAAADR